MPSSPRSTLILVRKSTRSRLDGLKGDATFDAIVSHLLDAAPAWAMRRRVTATPARATVREPAERRSPAKQVLLARLANEAWEKRVKTGEIRVEGPRLLVWTPPTGTEVAEVTRVEWPERRGFAP